ncbi:MAG: ABC transporter substrate-binding protein [Lawsonibacter sp.]
MKRNLSLLLVTALALSLLSGCGPKSSGSNSSVSSGSVSGSASGSASSSSDVSQPSTADMVRFTVLSGPTGVGAAKLLADNADSSAPTYNVTVATANDQVTADLIGPNPSTDIAALATNVAANLAAKTDGGIQVLAVNTLGVLYILEKGDTVHSIADLQGKTLYATGQGANPEYVLDYLLTQNKVDPAQVDIQWLTAQEITAKMTSADKAICMLPVPAATALMLQDTGIRQAVSLSEEWDKLDQGSLPMGCVVARTQFIEEQPQAVEEFLTQYQASIAYMNDPANLDAAAKLVARFELTPNETIAAKAIPQCNLTFLTGEDMKNMLEEYYQVLFQADPAAIGGSMPYDSFYYGVG